MPYDPAQLKLFGIALAMKRGETPYSYSAAAAEIARKTSDAWSSNDRNNRRRDSPRRRIGNSRLYAYCKP